MRISDWSSDVCSSDLHAIIGPNGAGKSTLFHLISGLFRPSSGEILLHGNPIHGLDARAINRLGMARSFQITNIFPGLSVFENLRLGIMRRHGLEYNFWKLISGAHKVKHENNELIEQIGRADV